MKYWRVILRYAGLHLDQLFWALDDGAGPYRLYSDQGRRALSSLSLDIPRVDGPAQDLHARMQRHQPSATVEVALSPFLPGQYHPRIFRPHNQPSAETTYERVWLDSVSAGRNILFRLEDAFRIVEPRPQNDDSFGHELRHLLILACTEVESACKSVLKANAYSATSPNRWKTSDYVKLLGVLYLNEWELALTRSPSYPRFKPFGGWNPSAPTTSLDWYDAYNRTKHDRENHLTDATLKRAIHAAGAAYVMVLAQFGQFGFAGERVREVDLFHVTATPRYGLEHHYIPPGISRGTSWTPLNHPL